MNAWFAAATAPSLVDRAVIVMVQHWTAHRGVSPSARLARVVLKLLGVDWRPKEIGPRLLMPHATTGSVVHWTTRIGSDVTVFHGVTIGRADPLTGQDDADADEGVVLEDGVLLGANAVLLYRRGQTLRVGRGTTVGACSVLLESTGANEVWAGSPAVRIR